MNEEIIKARKDYKSVKYTLILILTIANILATWWFTREVMQNIDYNNDILFHACGYVMGNE